MIFVGYDQLYKDTLELVKRLRTRPAAVYGIPRSGMLPASIIASLLHIPLGVVGKNGLELFPSGGRKAHEPEDGFLQSLVVDDSLATGNALNEAKKRITTANVLYGAVYVQPGSEKAVDVYGKAIDGNRAFAWNILNSGALSKCCVDIDGVLCRDPGVTEEEAYKEYILNAQPLSCPNYPIGAIVSGRSEDYRAETMAWLKKQHIRTGKLVLAPHQRGNICPELIKADFYKDSPYELFIESHEVQAKEIATLSGKPVLAVDTMRICE